ncbi:DUF4118 domain-containing protein [Pseudonocardia sp. RS010]|uniref:DUF4118 domain-containing protein n=1 Tax=Pseudonocardia sp. RS010 TaxID=3385979 RepID=UPI0039A34C6B
MVIPVAVAAGLSLLHGVLENTSAALVLVLVVVAVAVRGDRAAGVLAALASAVSFDFFLTSPFYRFVMVDRVDIQTAVLLAVVGVAVTEVALWGRREQDRAGRREGYLAGLTKAARIAREGSAAPELVATVGRMIAEVLDLDECRFSPDPPRRDRPQLHGDGGVTWNGRRVDVDREGLPTMDVIELPVGRPDGHGVFLLTASTRLRRPDLERRLVAVTLAEQVGGAAGALPGV